MTMLRLIHPIYLDVPMLVSFSAAIEGGLSLGKEITTEIESSDSRSAEVGVKFGLNKLFGALFDASLEGSSTGGQANRNQEVLKESRQHTEASIAILLYDHLLKNDEFIVRPEDSDTLVDVQPGALVEVAGTIVKNAIDAMIDYIDAVSILINLGDTPTPSASKKNRKPTPKSELESIKGLLDKDRKRTPISNALLRCTEPSGITAVITLRTENLRDLTLSELHKNNVRVVGKITRIIQKGEKMSAFENYGMALLEENFLQDAFNQLTSTPNMVTEFSELTVSGPAVQILPLMIYV